MIIGSVIVGEIKVDTMAMRGNDLPDAFYGFWIETGKIGGMQ
jgi:hypothetical protein